MQKWTIKNIDVYEVLANDREDAFKRMYAGEGYKYTSVRARKGWKKPRSAPNKKV